MTTLHTYINQGKKQKDKEIKINILNTEINSGRTSQTAKTEHHCHNKTARDAAKGSLLPQFVDSFAERC
jgi:hypothetical protein